MRLYAAILGCYPASFREEYGHEMRAIFARRWQRAAGAGARAVLLLDALLDALRNAPAAHADIFVQDLRTSWQAIRRAPVLSLTVVAVTAIGVGATTAAFAVADHVLIRPLPYREPDRLVKIWQHWPGPGDGRSQASPANFRDWRDHNRSFERIAGYEFVSRNLAGTGEPARLEGVAVTGELFATLGIRPLLGRTLVPGDDAVSALPTVVVSERFWRARFGADPSAVGRTVLLDDSAHAVVGVMPGTFEFPSRLVDFWIPLVLRPEQYVYGNPFIHAVARLRHGVSREQAHADVQAIARAAALASSQANPRVGAIVTTMRDEVTDQARLLLWILVAAAASLLLIACTNLANLLLTRGVGRQKELAVRAALGASRHRLTRQLSTENVLLAAAGGALAVGIAAAGIPTLVRLVPTTLPAAAAPAIDLRLLAAAMAATVASAVGFGILPVLRLAGHLAPRALQDGLRAGAGRRTTRLRAGLVVAQVSLSVLLLVASGLLLRAMLRVQATDPGFRTAGVLTMRTTLTVARYESGSRRDQFFGHVLEGVQALPGVVSAAYTSGLPMVDRGRGWFIQVPGDDALPQEQRIASLHFVTPRFFDTMGIPLRRGRDIASTDTQTSTPVSLVNESFVRRYWPGQDPLGRQFKVRGIDWTIVGVVGDVRISGLERPSAPQIYLAASQMPDRGLASYLPRDLVIRSDGPPEALVMAVRAIVAAADPRQPISDVQMLADVVGGETASRRVQVQVLATFAFIAFLLAGLGLHGLLAHNVSQGSREIGIRIALGAERRTILRMVARRGLQLAGAGTLIGGVLAVAAGRWLQALLAGVSPTDLLSFGGAAVLAVVMTASGSLLPALRAVRVDPLQAIRTE